MASTELVTNQAKFFILFSFVFSSFNQSLYHVSFPFPIMVLVSNKADITLGIDLNKADQLGTSNPYDSITCPFKKERFFCFSTKSA